MNQKDLNKYELEILADQQEHISNLKNNSKDSRVVKICSVHVIELINELNIIQKLNQKEDPLSSF